MRRLVAIVIVLLAAPARAETSPDGDALYARLCAACHGETGDGAGPAAPWLWPPPRDFTRARFKWRSTPSGKPPTDGDLAAAIRTGAPGTSMPAFAGILDDAQVTALVTKVKSFAQKRFASPGEPVPAPAPPADLAARAGRGRELFASSGCARCHGASGRGDGEAAAELADDRGLPARPFDLTTLPLRRGGGAAGVYLTLTTGLDGTPMGSFDGIADEDRWALAAYVDSIRAKTTWVRGAGPLAEEARKQSAAAGLTIEPQGAAPETLPPAAASLSSKQCGRCHAKQVREWSGSIHAAAAGPGLLGQFAMDAKLATPCQKCHAPLAEQTPGAAAYDEDLRAEGVTCASCHVRGWTRRGPPRRAESGLLSLPSYPFVEDAGYERSELCLPCHQLPPDKPLAGKPLLDTYREWLEGPYMPRGVQCQHCHMPDREHTWKGVHDEETVKQALDVDVAVARAEGSVDVSVHVTNVGAGHFFPTTPTPAAFLVIELLDDHGRAAATETHRIGRHIEFKGGKWIEHADTRVPPGALRTFTARLSSKGARTVRVRITMAPDEYYEGFYGRLLARKTLPAPAREQLETALERATKSRFEFFAKTVPIPSAK